MPKVHIYMRMQIEVADTAAIVAAAEALQAAVEASGGVWTGTANVSADPPEPEPAE